MELRFLEQSLLDHLCPLTFVVLQHTLSLYVKYAHSEQKALTCSCWFKC